jgi:hypothetical protein
MKSSVSLAASLIITLFITAPFAQLASAQTTSLDAYVYVFNALGSNDN